MKIFDKKEFAMATLNTNNKIFVVHIAALVELTTMLKYFFCQVQVVLLISEETKIFTEYSDFSNVFSLNSIVKLLEYIRINNHSIDLLNNKQLSYSLIYSLELVELKILKTYINTSLASSFIRPSRSPANAPILFI